MSERARGFSRREFMVKSVAVAGTVAAVGAAGSCESIKVGAKKKQHTRFGFTTYTWGRDWDIPTLIANCVKAEAFGVEMRTSQNYAHGVELEISAKRRTEVKKMFKDSPVTLVGLASGERFDWPDKAKLDQAIEATKGYVKLCHDIGATGLRVFPNDYHNDVPKEKTIAQIAEALNTVGAFAAGYGQQIRLEAHGSAGNLASIRKIMEQVESKSVRVKLNSDKRDMQSEGFEKQFALVKDYLGDTLHLHNLKAEGFDYQLQMDLLVKMGWSGWQLLEASDKVDDRLAALIEQKKIWDGFYANSVKG